MCFKIVLIGVLAAVGSLFGGKEVKKAEGAYPMFFPLIDAEKVHSVIEVGSRDALDALELSRYFKCHVYAFECNPAAIELCKKNIWGNCNVTLIPLGVMDKSGKMSFFHCPHEDYMGASSFFKFNPKGPLEQSLIYRWIWQEEIQVETIRLDEFLQIQGLEGVDLLCLDVQGAAYQVIRSLGNYLQNVNYIITELEQDAVIYDGEVLFDDVDRYLHEQGFIRISSDLKNTTGGWGDVLYKNKRLDGVKVL